MVDAIWGFVSVLRVVGMTFFNLGAQPWKVSRSSISNTIAMMRNDDLPLPIASSSLPS
jgi:hypothetical protein